MTLKNGQRKIVSRLEYYFLYKKDSQLFLSRNFKQNMEDSWYYDVTWGVYYGITMSFFPPCRSLHKGHPGITRMKSKAHTVIWWPNLDRDIEDSYRVCRCCPECQAFRALPPLAPLNCWDWTSKPWSIVHLEFAGPFLGNMFLIAIDAHSKWLEVHPDIPYCNICYYHPT